MRRMIGTAASIAVLMMAAKAEDLTLERVFASPDLSGAAPRALKLSPDGTLVTLLKSRADDAARYDLWAIDTTTGAERMLVDSLKLGTGAALSEAEKMQRERARVGGTKGIVAYDWAPDGRHLVVPLDGDVYLAGVDGEVKRLTATPESELNATMSPKGGFVSYLRGQNLFAVDLATGAERQLTKDGGGTVSWGEAEFVAQEEMGRMEGHWWSPDDRYLAAARVDEAEVKIVQRAAIGADGTKIFEQRYPRAGTPNAHVELYILPVDGGAPVKADLGAWPDIYLARVDWLPDGSALIVQRENRAQNRLDVLKIEPATGKATPLFNETSKSWVNLNDDLTLLSDGSLLWSSERTGFNHVYLFRKGKWTQMTTGNWSVRNIVAVDEANGLLYVLGNRDTPVEQHLYQIEFEQPGWAKRLTEKGWWNDAVMDKAATRAVITRSNPDQPPQVYLAEAKGKRLAWLSENAVVEGHPYAPYRDSHQTPGFGTLKAADGSELAYKLITPKLEPGRKYPVLVQVYGGPGGGRQALKQWDGRSGALQQYFVDRGWIVFSVDGRGTPDRGKAFEDQIKDAMGTVEVEDQLAGVEWLKKQDFVDPKKIAVYGWSYGGYMTLKLLEKAPGVFAAGVSGAPVTKWELYDTHYTERYLGDPGKQPKVYEKANALTDAAKIADPLLLIHGMADDNVVFDNSLGLIARLQENAVPFETMLYPGQTHRFADEKINLHLWKTIGNFLDRTLGVGQ